jgi:RimJ/RimL family protein N-acetyltransferase
VPSNPWPLRDLRISTPRLVLRYPSEDELAILAEVAAAGVHLPGERPYLTPWTEGTPEQTAAHVVEQHRRRQEEWTPDAWALGLAVFVDDHAIGMVALRAREFAVLREVTTGSWLGLNYHRQGYGTESRAALLHFAFEHLGAESARTDVFRDNAGSQGVSRRLGYRSDGISRDIRDGEVVISDRLRLDRADWYGTERETVVVDGLAGALPFFGL